MRFRRGIESPETRKAKLTAESYKELGATAIPELRIKRQPSPETQAFLEQVHAKLFKSEGEISND